MRLASTLNYSTAPVGAFGIMPLRINDTPIPHHVLVKFLGSGALGDVWLVRGPGGVHKAAKFIRLDGRHATKELLAIQHMKMIHHPHLVQITDVWLLDEDGEVIPEEAIDRLSEQFKNKDPKISPRSTMVPDLPRPDMLVVAMTLADRNLFDRLQEYRDQGQEGIPCNILLRYMQEAAKGIDFLNQPHAELGGKAMQHCDIKPQNLLLVGDSVQLCDFGLARLVGERKTANNLEGTVAYIAPEAAKGQQPTPTTDQYSLAISYYELRTGRLPFDETSPIYDIIAVHASGKLDFEGVSPAEQKVLRKATSLDPEKRFSSNTAMVEALHEANCPPKPAPSSRTKKAVLGVQVLLLAVMIGLVSWLLLRNPETQNHNQIPIQNIQLPLDFVAAQGSELQQIGDRFYPKKIARTFPDGERVDFLLIYEPDHGQPFYMMEHKCWNGLFRKFATEHPDVVKDAKWEMGAQTTTGDIGASDPLLPVFNVSVDQAYAFAKWLGGPKNGHLPSLDQWNTAAGLYRPGRQGAGPYREPVGPNDIAVNRESEGPMKIGEAAKDVSPFLVCDMAGNGKEYTRTLVSRRGEVPLPEPQEIDGVLLRGRSFAEETPLHYTDLEDVEKDELALYLVPEPTTSFRVVLEKLSGASNGKSAGKSESP